MKRIRSVASGLILLIPLVSILLAFQNCAPAVPIIDGTVENASVRPTATPDPWQFPSGTPSGTPIPTTPTAGWEGVCVNSSAEDPMAFAGNDTLPGMLSAFIKGDQAAIWLHTSNIISARVCRMNGAGWNLKALANTDGVGVRDLVWRNADGRLAVWLMNGTNRKAGAILANTIASDWKLEGVGDFDRDGAEDLNFRHLDGRVQVWLMNGFQVKAIADIGSVASDWHLRGVGNFDGLLGADLLYRKETGEMSIWFLSGTTVTTRTPRAAHCDSTVLSSAASRCSSERR